MMKRAAEQDFWSKVFIPDNPNGCWMWLPKNSRVKGYGYISYQRKSYRVHRLSYELTYGPFDKKWMVLHLCGVRACVNPRHLYLGTAQDNSNDARDDGTRCRGESHGLAKLTNDQVIAIRAGCELGESSTALAQKYGVARTTVRDIATRRFWKHL